MKSNADKMKQISEYQCQIKIASSPCRKRRAVNRCWMHILLLPLFLWNDISYFYQFEAPTIQEKIHLRTGRLFRLLLVQASLQEDEFPEEEFPTNVTAEKIPNAQHSLQQKLRNNKAFHRNGSQSTVSQPLTQQKQRSPLTISQILKRAGKSGLGGGISGAIAGFIQVFTLMWLRTVVNYQCRYGTTFRQALITLYQQGGIPRFYRGLSFALIQAPLARFISTAANDGVETLVASLEATKHWGPGRTTVVASIVVGIWRMIIMPIDTCKTVLQVDSVEGFRNLMRKVKAGKIDVLYQGASANALSAILGHYPWFYTFTFLSNNKFLKHLLPSKLLRNASIGFFASIVSDTIVNAFRVVKTTKQSLVAKHAVVSYGEVVAMILAADGWKGLFGRGLGTRYLTNALQSIVFTVIWRGFAEKFSSKNMNTNEQKIKPGPGEENSDSREYLVDKF